MRDFGSYSMKDVVFNENEDAILAIGDDKNITNTKLDRFMINNNIRNRSKARTKEQKVQVLQKLRQRDTVFTSMYTKDTPLRKNSSKGKGKSKGTKPTWNEDGNNLSLYQLQSFGEDASTGDKNQSFKIERCTMYKVTVEVFVEVASMYNEANQKELNCLKIDGDDMYWFEGKGVDKNF